jgi:hypothetical protein
LLKCTFGKFGDRGAQCGVAPGRKRIVGAQITTALLSGIIVALIVVAGIGALAWAQIRNEHERWSADAKVARALELHKARLASYPVAMEAIAPLSTHCRAALTAEVAGEVAEKLNTWLYSTGGMCADATTRAAVLGLRDSCQTWAAKGGARPPQLYEFRNLTIAYLRLDLDLPGLEPFDPHRGVTLLAKLRDDLDAFDKRIRD